MLLHKYIIPQKVLREAHDSDKKVKAEIPKISALTEVIRLGNAKPLLGLPEVRAEPGSKEMSGLYFLLAGNSFGGPCPSPTSGTTLPCRCQNCPRPYYAFSLGRNTYFFEKIASPEQKIGLKTRVPARMEAGHPPILEIAQAIGKPIDDTGSRRLLER